MTQRQKCGHRRPPGARWRITDRRLIVDVSNKDWSDHPAWSSDFEAEVMTVRWHERIPDWVTPADLVAIVRVYECDECEERVRRREPFGL